MVKLLGLIRTITFSFSSTLYCCLLLPWSGLNLNILLLLGPLLRLLTLIHLNAYTEHLQPFVTADFFQDLEYNFDNLLKNLNLLTLCNRLRPSHAVL